MLYLLLSLLALVAFAMLVFVALFLIVDWILHDPK